MGLKVYLFRTFIFKITGYELYDRRMGVRLTAKDFLLFTVSTVNLGPTEPYFHWVTGAFFPKV